MGVRASGCLREAFIFSADNLLAVHSLEAAHGEVAPRDLLEMLDECVVHCSAAQRADERDSLCCELLRHDHPKTGRHLGDKANENRAAFLDGATLDLHA